MQAATRAYCGVRVLASPFTLANYVILGWLIGLGRAGYGLAAADAAERHQHRLQRCFVLGLGYGVAGVGWASVIAEATTTAAGGWLVSSAHRRRRGSTLRARSSIASPSAA